MPHVAAPLDPWSKKKSTQQAGPGFKSLLKSLHPCLGFQWVLAVVQNPPQIPVPPDLVNWWI